MARLQFDMNQFCVEAIQLTQAHFDHPETAPAGLDFDDSQRMPGTAALTTRGRQIILQMGDWVRIDEYSREAVDGYTQATVNQKFTIISA